MPRFMTPIRPWPCLAPLALSALVCGCTSSAEHIADADDAAYGIVADAQRDVLGSEEPFSVDPERDTLRRRLVEGQDIATVGPESIGSDRLIRPEHWPDDEPDAWPDAEELATQVAPWGEGAYELTLVDALQVGARGSREYQDVKEGVFLAALDLDLERNRFRTTLLGVLTGVQTEDRRAESGSAPDGSRGTATGEATKLLENGALLAGRLGIDLARLRTGERPSAMGIFGDASIAIPLLRGAGAHVVTEPLTQLERGVVYSLRTFERFKRTFAVRVASEYLDVARQVDRVSNEEENYRGLVVLTRRTQALDAAGRLPGIQVDQAKQDELRARSRWIAAVQELDSRLDRFKDTLGLPPDAQIVLPRSELDVVADGVRVTLGPDQTAERAVFTADNIPGAEDDVELEHPRSGQARLELDEAIALPLALESRLDLATARDRVDDAQRAVVVAADARGAGLTLSGRAVVGERRDIGSAGRDDGRLEPTRGIYTADALIDLPLERTAERNAYRESYVLLERSVRDLQESEDRVKREVRASLRTLVEAREGVRIQEQAVELARDRVESTGLFLEAGRAQVRDVLEAREDLIAAQNALTDALVRYRVAELELQRDLGVLAVDHDGLWMEYEPDED